MITLDAIRDEANVNYGSYDIEIAPGKVTKLQNPLRIPSDKRKKMAELEDRMKDPDSDQVAALRELITLTAETPTQAKNLIAAIGDDLAVLIQVFRKYGEAVRVGEA